MTLGRSVGVFLLALLVAAGLVSLSEGDGFVLPPAARGD
jgi:hypothetical protein